MKDLIIYECEFCHAQYKEKRRKCEKNRHKPVKLVCCNYDSKISSHPDYIDIVFDDDKVLRYKR